MSQRFYRVMPDGSRVEFFPRRGRSRPRRCTECHNTATHVEIENRNVVTILQDGTPLTSVNVVCRYWCEDHSGISHT